MTDQNTTPSETPPRENPHSGPTTKPQPRGSPVERMRPGDTITAYAQGPFATEVEEGPPEGFVRVTDARVYVRGEEVVIVGTPDESTDGDEHNCDAMGCSSILHVILRGRMRWK